MWLLVAFRWERRGRLMLPLCGAEAAATSDCRLLHQIERLNENDGTEQDIAQENRVERGGARMPEDLILDMRGIWKSYPGVSVFEGFDFDLRAGEIHCICGENGAGKSTLIKILSGAHSPDRGTILFEGRKVENLSPHSAMQMGIQTIY